MFVKICGTTSLSDAQLSIDAGADALGFIFAESKRQVFVADVAAIVAALPAKVMTVGVFRNHSVDSVVETVRATGVTAVQLHGEETLADVAAIRAALGVPIIKALAGDSPDLVRADEWGADYLLLDAPSPGSGTTFDWSLAARVPAGQRVLLAGGLNADNVTAAIAAVQPFGVDAVSGVELAPGVKDPTKLRSFIATAKAH